jgi:hypothetical protein
MLHGPTIIPLVPLKFAVASYGFPSNFLTYSETLISIFPPLPFHEHILHAKQAGGTSTWKYKAKLPRTLSGLRNKLRYTQLSSKKLWIEIMTSIFLKKCFNL